MISLDELLNQYDIKSNEVKHTLTENEGKTMLWIKNNRCFYILSKSAKKEGYQLTYFIDNKPVSDRIRINCLDDDIVNDLVINECYLKGVV